MALDFKRQTGIFNPDNFKEKVSLVGCGSVGSFTALALAKMGLNIIELFDSDSVEEHNLPNQFYKLKNLNTYKNEALSDLLIEFTGKTPQIFDNVVSNSLLQGDIIVSAVDSMEARKLIWERVKETKPRLYIDTRMAGKIFSIFTVDMINPHAKYNYEKSLAKETEALQVPCTQRAIIFNVLGIASFVCNQIVKYLNQHDFCSEVHFDYEDLRCVKIR